MPKIVSINSAYSGTCVLVFLTVGSSIFMKLDSIRIFRDRFLKRLGFLGKIMVDFYYKLSPFLCNKLNENKTMRQIFFSAATPFIYLIHFLIKI